MKYRIGAIANIKRLIATLFLFVALPSSAGVIALDFIATVSQSSDRFSPNDGEITGTILFELANIEDLDPGRGDALFEDGQSVGTDLGWVDTVQVDIASNGEVKFSSGGGSAQLRIQNRPNNDSLSFAIRDFTSGFNPDLTRFNLLVSGATLFSGDNMLESSLGNLEAFLLGFDGSDARQLSGVAIGDGIVDDLQISSIAFRSVPEPGTLLLLFAFGLMLLTSGQRIALEPVNSRVQ